MAFFRRVWHDANPLAFKDRGLRYVFGGFAAFVLLTSAVAIPIAATREIKEGDYRGAAKIIATGIGAAAMPFVITLYHNRMLGRKRYE